MLFLLQTVTTYAFKGMRWSQMLTGYTTEEGPRHDYWAEEHHRFPMAFTFVCFSGVCFNAVATIETSLSMVFGKLHKNMVSGMCYVSLPLEYSHNNHRHSNTNIHVNSNSFLSQFFLTLKGLEAAKADKLAADQRRL